eukprot:CAMPEP_0183293178 /NCGR_PEP_ID=MMETSP0160_2-20130417/1960_1 /TAXON_ID=2839 ORGANISM="Odontella Sinensis, Strain Grunow 1884" /NCGR_SAMPLE_ID=MMETSP0160_2 /ASSEMBLY_ACC=CAM_ASM_000250 /LENGTH=592 /DNA_ID=CAMNT_0025454253 /DNA_START=37 /DNA_END=1815 /DNA_ORIENTATION=-
MTVSRRAAAGAAKALKEVRAIGKKQLINSEQGKQLQNGPLCPFSTAPETLKFENTVAEQSPKPEALKTSASNKLGCPVLRHVPSLPFVGSMIPEYSGLPKFTLEDQYENNNVIRKKFGNFITLGFPTFGTGYHGTLYSIYDPNEMMKVVRNEGDKPSGIVEKLWAWRRALKDSGSALVSLREDGEYDYGLFDRGDGWKRQRTFLQTGMLDPRAARDFVPGIVEAAEQASQAAPAHASDVNEYLNYTAFDMFCSFMFGTQMRTTSTIVLKDDEVRKSNAENEKFVNAALAVFEKTNRMNLVPTELIMGAYLPFMKSSMYLDFENEWNIVREVGLKKIRDFIDRYDRNELDEMEQASYLAGAIERQRSTKEVSEDEMMELCLTALFVGVDTTSSVTAWNLMHLALNPDIQEKLHSELSVAVKERGSEGGTKINADVLGKKASPYLHMCLRESHRVTPAFGGAMWKGNSRSEVEIHGEIIPKGSLVQLGHVSYDPEYVDSPQDFRPERWTPEGVASRKDTKSEVLDHPYLRDPFSQGARRCPGSRVATNEILAMIAQLVLDWNISAPTIQSSDDVKYTASPIKPIFPTLQFESRQ